MRELRDGRLVVTDRVEKLVHLVDMTAGTTRRVGAEGGGPNEYRMPMSALAMPGDSTLVFDAGNMRYLVVAPDGEVARTFSPAQDGEAPMMLLSARGVDGEGNLYFLDRGILRTREAGDDVPSYDVFDSWGARRLGEAAAERAARGLRQQLGVRRAHGRGSCVPNDERQPRIARIAADRSGTTQSASHQITMCDWWEALSRSGSIRVHPRDPRPLFAEHDPRASAKIRGSPAQHRHPWPVSRRPACGSTPRAPARAPAAAA